MSKITNDGLTRSGTGFTQIATVGVKELKLLVPPLSHPTPPLEPPQLQNVEPPLITNATTDVQLVEEFRQII